MTTRERLDLNEAVDLTLNIPCGMDFADTGACGQPARWRARWTMHCQPDKSELELICEYHKVHLSLPVWICGQCKQKDIVLMDQVTLLERL